MTYYEKNKNARLNYQKQYYQENKEEIKKYTKNYYDLNKHNGFFLITHGQVTLRFD